MSEEATTNGGGEPDPHAPKFIRWDAESMSTGVPKLDEEHRNLIDQLNELYQAHHRELDVSHLNKMMHFLGNYARQHFSHEEGVMREHKCPMARQNRAAHAEFLREYNELSGRFSLDADPDEVATEIERMVGRWLVSHICRVDTSLRNCLRPSPAPPAK